MSSSCAFQTTQLSLENCPAYKGSGHYGPASTNGTSGGSTTAPDEINDAFRLTGYTSYRESKTEASQELSGAEDGTSYANLLVANIQAHHPCIISAWAIYHNGVAGILPSPGGDGHTWVCDGSNITNYYSGTRTTYSDGSTSTVYPYDDVVRLLHMNWGWDDPYSYIQDDQYQNVLTNNGWYDADTNYTQADTQGENFPYFQILEYNIHP